MGTEKVMIKMFYDSKIPNDWRVSDFGNEFDFLKTYSFSRSQLTAKGTRDQIRNIHYGDIHSTYHSEILDLDNEDTVPYLLDGLMDLNVFENKLFPSLRDGDLIIADASEDYEGICDCVELKNVDSRKVIGGLHTFAARAKNNIALGFRAYVLRHQKTIKELRRIATGTSVYGVSKTNLAKIKLAIPPLPEQKEIAKALGLMDEAINLNNKLIALKELRKKWLLQNLLTGKKRLIGFNEEWKETSLSNIFYRTTRKNEEGNTNVVTISAQKGFIRQKDYFNKNVASTVLDNYFLVKKGEFCYNKSYSNGYPKGATKRLNNFEHAVVTTLYICFGIKDKTKTSGDFFEQFFEANYLDRGLTKIAHEGGRAHGLLNVTPSDFFSLKITIPQVEEQKSIAQILCATDKEINHLKAKTDKLIEQKKGMMQVLLTGKKRLKFD